MQDQARFMLEYVPCLTCVVSHRQELAALFVEATRRFLDDRPGEVGSAVFDKVRQQRFVRGGSRASCALWVLDT